MATSVKEEAGAPTVDGTPQSEQTKAPPTKKVLRADYGFVLHLHLTPLSDRAALLSLCQGVLGNH